MAKKSENSNNYTHIVYGLEDSGSIIPAEETHPGLLLIPGNVLTIVPDNVSPRSNEVNRSFANRLVQDRICVYSGPNGGKLDDGDSEALPLISPNATVSPEGGASAGGQAIMRGDVSKPDDEPVPVEQMSSAIQSTAGQND
jgi:hypothetical protein